MTTGYGVFNKCSNCCDEWPFWSVSAIIRPYMFAPLTGPAPYNYYLTKTLTISVTVSGTLYSYTGSITVDPLTETVSTSESGSWSAQLQQILDDFVYTLGFTEGPSVSSVISTYNSSGFGTLPSLPNSTWSLAPAAVSKTFSGAYAGANWNGSISVTLSSPYTTGPADVATLLASRDSNATMDAAFLANVLYHKSFIVAYNKASSNALNGAAYPGGNYDSAYWSNYPSSGWDLLAQVWPTWRNTSGHIYNPTGSAPTLASTTVIDTGDEGGLLDYNPISSVIGSYFFPGGLGALSLEAFQTGLIYVRRAVPVCLVESSVPISVAADGSETIGSTTTTYTLATYSAGSMVTFSSPVPSAGSSSWTNSSKYMKAGATLGAIWKAAHTIYPAPTYLTCP